MVIKKSKLSEYNLHRSLARITPSSSLTETEWDNESSYQRRKTARRSCRKKKYISLALTCGLTVVILSSVAILVPVISIYKSTTTTTMSTVISVSNTTFVTVTSVTTTTPITTTSMTTISSSTFTSTATTSSATASITTATISGTNMTTFVVTSSTATTSKTTTTSSMTTTVTTTTTSSMITTVTTTSETTTSITSSNTTPSMSATNTPLNVSVFQWNSTSTTFVGEINITSASPIYLNLPVGIVFDSSDRLYVADSGNNRVQKFWLDNSTGTTVAGSSTGVTGVSASLLKNPNDVAVDLSGNIYVVDTDNHRVQLWRVNTSSAITIAGNGTAGNASNQLDTPFGIALDSNTNTFYVSDGNNDRVMKYILNSTVGTIVAGGNGQGKNTTQLYTPKGLHFDSSTNSLIIANYGAHNIVRWIIGASNWTLVAGSLLGTFGSTSITLRFPSDVTLDPMGNVYVADRANHRIQFFRPGVFNGTTIAGETATSGNDSVRLNRPLSIALDSQLNLYVSDSFNNRIQKFQRY